MAISNVSNGLRSGVCTSSTRPSSPYEGQVIYETDTDLSYVWNGSAWTQIFGGNSAGNSGLVHIKTQSISGSTFNDIDNVFSSTYDNYRVTITLWASANFNTGWIQYLDSTGTSVGSGYYGSVYGQDFTSASTTFQTATANSVQYIGWIPNVAVSNSYRLFASLDISNPAIAMPTGVQGQFTGINAGSAFLGGQVLGIHTGSTVMRGIRVANSQGSTQTGSISVYGYRK